MWVLGLANSHNGAIALIKDGRVEVAIQLERLVRQKRFPLHLVSDGHADGVPAAVEYCLHQCNISIKDIDVVAASTPWPMKAEAAWPKAKVCWVPHHLAHAEYVLHFSQLKPGLVFIVDGHGSQECDRASLSIQEKISPSAKLFSGEVETVSAYDFDGNDLSLVYRMCGSRAGEPQLLEGSIGQLWELGSAICFGVRDEAGKVMGLAAYGSNHLRQQRLLQLDTNGRLLTNFTALMDSSFSYRDIAHEIQAQTSEILLELLTQLRLSGSAGTLYYSGGVALNVVSNERIVRSGMFEAVCMNSSSEDNGTAVGAALAAYHHIAKRRVPEKVTDYHGASYSSPHVRWQLQRFPVTFKKLEPSDVTDLAAKKMAEGKIIGWYQGRGEFGPRALGNRSILANPCGRNTRDILNGRVKHRESFRPYASAVLLDKVANYFDLQGNSPVMLREANVLDPELPAVTHIDGTSRIQTVSREDNPRLYDLIEKFGERTGKYVLLNTSLNIAGQPIVETPEDTILTFLRTEIDCMFLEDYVIEKK
jgi:carbamoyltransferase